MALCLQFLYHPYSFIPEGIVESLILEKAEKMDPD